MTRSEQAIDQLFSMLMERSIDSSRGIVFAVHNNDGVLDRRTLAHLTQFMPTNNPFVERVGNSYKVPSHIASYIEDKTVLTETGGFRYMAA